MPVEISYLIASVGLYFVMILAQSTSAIGAVASGQTSAAELAGARDNMPAAGVSPFHARCVQRHDGAGRSDVFLGPRGLCPAILVWRAVGAHTCLVCVNHWYHPDIPTNFTVF